MPTILITGCNRGFGFLLTDLFADAGWHVLACCRNPDQAPELQELGRARSGAIDIFALDVTDHDAIDALAQELEGTTIDVLLNNAGVLGKINNTPGVLETQAFGKFDAEEWDLLWRVNTVAPMKMAEAFVDHVAASEQKKIVTLTSVIGSIGGNQFGGLYAYRASKAAANAIMKSMSVDLATRGIIAFPLHPGYAKTDMGGAGADIEPIEGAEGIFKVICEADEDAAGRFWMYDGSELPW